MMLLIAVFVGMNTVVSRYLNATFARHNGVAMGTLANYATGLATALVLLWLVGEPLTAQPLGPLTFRTAAMFLGGAVGMVMVQMTICFTPRLPAFLATLLVFVSQLTTGLLLDCLLTGRFSLSKLLGAMLVLTGLCHYAWVGRDNAKTEIPADSRKNAKTDAPGESVS